jgi:peptide-methionine (S)-S-oxide reductase
MKNAVLLSVLLGATASAIPQQIKTMENTTNTTELATFGGGCFWCLEAVFEGLDGVKSVTSGYAGGKKDNPTYKEVCSDTTGHAEVVQVQYDPKKLAYEKLLDLFWQAHDPTTKDRQGADVGSQYRSIILYHNETQKAAAEKSKKQAAAQFRAPIVTEIVPLTRFYKAEAYHQDYFRNNPRAPYCAVVIRPKLEKLKAKIGQGK